MHLSFRSEALGDNFIASDFTLATSFLKSYIFPKVEGNV